MEQGTMKKKRNVSVTSIDRCLPYLEYSYGCLQRRLNCNSFIFGSSLIYINGGCITVQNIIQSCKKFVSLLPNQIHISAIACSSDMNILIAVASFDEGQSSLNVYAEQDASSFNITVPTYDPIIDLLFQGNRLFAMTKNSEMLVIPNIKDPFRRMYKANIPIKATRLCDLTGDKIVICCYFTIIVLSVDSHYVYLIQEIRLYQPVIDAILFENDNLVALTKDKLMSFKNGEMVEITTLPYNAVGSCIIKFSKGFFVGLANRICALTYMVYNNHMSLYKTFQVLYKTKGSVVSLHLSPDEMYVSMTAMIGEGGSNLCHLENLILNLSNVNIDKSSLGNCYRFFKNNMYYGHVTSIKNSMTPFLYTLTGVNLLTYSYSDNFKPLNRLVLSYVPSDIAVHPLGCQIACVYKDCLRVYLRIESYLVELIKIAKSSTCAQYSGSGLLAIGISNGTHYYIYLIDCIKFRTFKTLTCCSPKHPMTKIQWTKDDTQLYVSAGLNEFYVVDVYQNVKRLDFCYKKRGVTCLHFDNETSTLLVAFSDSTLKRYIYNSTYSYYDKPIEYKFTYTITSLNILLGNSLVFGTSIGNLYCRLWPIDNDQTELKTDYKIHLADEPLTHAVKASQKYLVVMAASGLLFALRLKKKKDNMLVNVEPDDYWSKFKDIVVESKNSLEQTKYKLKTLLEKRLCYLGYLEELQKEEDLQYMAFVYQLQKYRREIEKENLTSILEAMKEKRLVKKQLIEEKQQILKKTYEHSDKYLLQLYDDHAYLHYKLKCLEKRCKGEYYEASYQFRNTKMAVEQYFYIKLSTSRSILKYLREILRLDGVGMGFWSEELSYQTNAMKNREYAILCQYHYKLCYESYELKARVSRLKRYIYRYGLRKDFLESKKKYLEGQFVVEQNHHKAVQRLRNTIILELMNLYDMTNKKYQMIQYYSNKNDKLESFREVYSYLQDNLQQDTNKLKYYDTGVSSQIMHMNEELVRILNENTRKGKIINGLSERLGKLKNSVYDQRKHLAAIGFTYNSTLQKMSHLVKVLPPHWRKDIYYLLYKNQYLIDKVQPVEKSLTRYKEVINDVVQQGNMYLIQNNLNAQKSYLYTSIRRFSANYKILEDELTSTFVKLQAGNSNLITECNILKEKLNKKRKCLNYQLNNVKMSESLFNNMENQPLKTTKNSQNYPYMNLYYWFAYPKRLLRKNSDIPFLRVNTQHKSENEARDQSETKCSTVGHLKRVNTAERGTRSRAYMVEDIPSCYFRRKPGSNQGSRNSIKREVNRNGCRTAIGRRILKTAAYD